MNTDLLRLRDENPLPDIASSFGITLQQDGHEWTACCPFHKEDTPSFTMFKGKDGHWRFHCFGCNERGDVMDFVQKIKGVDFKTAVKILGGEVKRDNVRPAQAREVVDIYAGIQPLMPTGEIKAGKRIKIFNPKRAGTQREWGSMIPSMVFPYRNEDGALFGYVLRHDLPEGRKETPMVMWVRLANGTECWCRYPFPKPRPIFGLDRVAADPGKQVVLVEGEKCATVGSAVTGRLFVSWAGGTYGINHTDFTPLAGRSVVIWPDADGPGRMTAEAVGNALLKLGCTVKMMNVSDKPKGWDVADAADEGWTRDDINSFMRSRVSVYEGKPDDGPADTNDDGAGDRLDGGDIDRGDLPPDPEPLPDDYYADTLTGDQWEPDPFGGLGEVEIDKSEAVIEYSPQARRVVPASGRATPSQHFRVWGGDVDQLRQWVYLSVPERFIHIHTGDIMSKSAFDLVMPNITPMVEIENAKGELKSVRYSPSKTLVEYCDGIVCADKMYRPDLDDALIWVDGILHLNSFLPSTVPTADPDWQNKREWHIVKSHIENVIPDGAAKVIQWMAHNVQFPGRKILWAPIIVGEQGDGKTTIGAALQAAMGRKNVGPVSTKSLFSDFTAWQQGKAVRVLEELYTPGMNKADLVETLKEPLTNAVLDVVRKGADGVDVANVTNYMGLTNHINALAITEGDRRFGVWRTRFSDRSQVVRELTSDYWKRLHDAINKHPEILRGWLLSVDLSDFNPYEAPEMTDAKLAMIDASRSGPSADIREAIALGSFGVCGTALAADCLVDAIRKAGGRAPSSTVVSNTLLSMGWMRLDDAIKWRRKSRRAYYLPGEWSENLKTHELKDEIRNRLDMTGDDEDGWPRDDGKIDGW